MMVNRYTAEGMRLVGKYFQGQYCILFGEECDTEMARAQMLGEGPSLVEALDDALQNAIALEEMWQDHGAR